MPEEIGDLYLSRDRNGVVCLVQNNGLDKPEAILFVCEEGSSNEAALDFARNLISNSKPN